MTINVDRLTKLLNLTQSDNDHEALSALRMANRYLNDQKTSWALLLAPFQRELEGEDDDAYEDPELEAACRFKMPFGKYRGKTLLFVPLPYLMWVAENIETERIRNYAEIVLDFRLKHQ